ncbi:hypothetical protein Y032_0384g410 [Ancylostoma ceylanicum]|uniref:Uncharacterized protein n=1 Tax=Ancylostoma ceylanicum TaxID=53326 RepID=A0A016RSY1_9BILA|nr:hypothetical protein Y032_0384g410 [Ancylostoma ceylanicum]
MTATKMVGVVLFNLAVYSTIVAGGSDGTFKRFCSSPANFGKGNLIEENTCQLTYDITTPDDTYAYNFCDRQHPFTLFSATRDGSKTVCRIKTYYKCKGGDTLIGNKCFIPRAAVEYAKAKESCGRDYTFYTITSGFDQKWIAAFFTRYNMMWIANKKTQLKHLKHVLFEGKTLHNKEARLVDGSSEGLAILARKGAKAGISAGTITSVSLETPLNVLCYRDAEQLDGYFMALVERMGDAGLSSRVYTDSHGQKRNFLIYRSLHVYETNDDEFGAGAGRLHSVCKGFTRGYAASPLDFKNVDDFKELLQKEGVNIVAIPGRKTGAKIQNLGTCNKDPSYKMTRNQYYIDLPDGTQKVVENNFWQDTMPDRTCADTPRTALGFSQKGVVDLPAIARLFAVCTYGRSYQADSSGEEHTCHRFAYYDKNQCRCRNEAEDIRVTKLFPISESEKTIKPGTQCLDCSGRGDHDIAIVIDCSHHVSNFDHYKILYKNLLLTFAMHKSRSSTYVFGSQEHVHARRNVELTISDDIQAYAINELNSWKHHIKPPLGSGGSMSAAVEEAFNHLKNLANNKRLLVLVVAGEQTDTEKTHNLLRESHQLIAQNWQRAKYVAATVYGWKACPKRC